VGAAKGQNAIRIRFGLGLVIPSYLGISELSSQRKASLFKHLGDILLY